MIDASNTERYSDSANRVRQAVKAIEALIDATPKEDGFALGLLGSILSELKESQSTIERLADQQTNA